MADSELHPKDVEHLCEIVTLTMKTFFLKEVMSHCDVSMCLIPFVNENSMSIVCNWQGDENCEELWKKEGIKLKLMKAKIIYKREILMKHTPCITVLDLHNFVNILKIELLHIFILETENPHNICSLNTFILTKIDNNPKFLDVALDVKYFGGASARLHGFCEPIILCSIQIFRKDL